MKKLKWLCLVIASVMALALFAACKPGGDETTKYTVTYYDGSSVLRTEEVEDGGKATRWTPETREDGYTFEEWYATPTFTHVFDFNTVIKEDTPVFAMFAAPEVADTRDFYILGNGTSPLLSASNWGATITDDYKLAKTEGKNEYKITLDLIEGDLFQFAINGSWHNQRGYGYLTETKLADGTEVFSGSGTIGENSAKRQNINVQYSGNYTLTLTTHPADDTYETTNASYTESNKESFNINPRDTITWVRNGDAAEVSTDKVEYFIKGKDITNWQDMYNNYTRMTENNGVYTLTVYLKENDEFMFTSLATIEGETNVGTSYIRYTNLDAAGKELFTGSNNMVAKASGNYTFTYTAATEVLTATYAAATPAAMDYYIDGNFDGHSYGDYQTNAALKLIETVADSGIYTVEGVTLTEGAEWLIRSYEAGATPTWDNMGPNYQFTYLFGAGTSFEAASATNENIKVLKAGTYNVTFNRYSKMITFENADLGLDVYISGSMEGQTGWNPNFEAQWKFTKSATEADVYELTLTFAEGVQFGLRTFPEGTTEADGVNYTWVGVSAMGTAGDANSIFQPESGNNFTCSVAGAYKLVYNAKAGTLDIYAVNA